MSREDLKMSSKKGIFPDASTTDRSQRQFRNDLESIAPDGVFGGTMDIITAQYTVTHSESHLAKRPSNLQAAILLDLWEEKDHVQRQKLALLASPFELIQFARQILRQFDD